MRFFKIILVILFFYPINYVFAHQDPEIAGYIDVDGGRIWYRMNGSEHLGKRPAIIMMHGGPGGTHRGNMPYVALADQFPVILYDQLGSGNSDRPKGKDKWTVEYFVSEIDQIRKALGLNEIIIAGHSWGGTLAAEYARRNPKGLRAAILSSPLISTKQWIEDNQKWVDQLPKDVAETIHKHIAAGTQSNPDYLKAEKIFYSRHMCRKDPCPNQHYKKDGPAWNPKLYIHMWGNSDFYATGTLLNYDISNELSKITVPTLMICGEFDEAAPESCKKYADKIKKSKNVVVPDAGHATMAEDESFYMTSIRSFLNLLEFSDKKEIKEMLQPVEQKHHTVNYIEFPANDLIATKAFFNRVFGWEFQDYGPDYTSFSGQGTDGGFFKSDLKSSRENGVVTIVLYSGNLEKSYKEVKDAGGNITEEIFSFPGGRRFHFTEPSGNELAVWSE